MIPDKIFIDEDLISFHVLQTKHDGDICYIRKDTLMKIIETARESSIIQRNFNNCPAKQEGRIDAYDYIKHKIESL